MCEGVSIDVGQTTPLALEGIVGRDRHTNATGDTAGEVVGVSTSGDRWQKSVEIIKERLLIINLKDWSWFVLKYLDYKNEWSSKFYMRISTSLLD